MEGRVITVGLVNAPPYACDRAGGGYAGWDVEIIEAMASALNFSVVYIPVKDLQREKGTEDIDWYGFPGPWEAVVIALHSSEVDIGLGGFFIMSGGYGGLGYTQPYARDSVAFYATTDLTLSQDMHGLILPVILQMISVHVCTSMVMYLLELTSHRRRRKRDLGQTAIMVWSLLTEISSDIRNLSSRQVLLWAACAFFVINMNTVYKSFFISLSTRPLFAEKIKTVADMIQSDLPFLHTAPIPNDRSVMSPEERYIVLSRATHCVQPLATCLAAFLPETNFCMSAHAQEKNFVEFVMRNELFHVLDRKLNTFYTGIFTRRDFPLTRKMTMLHRSDQAGLIRFWYFKTLRERLCDLNAPLWQVLRNAYADKYKFRKYKPHSARPLTTIRLYPQFQILWQGLAVAAVVFFVEFLTLTRRFQLMWTRFKARLPFLTVDC